MVNAERITLRGKIVYESVQIFSQQEQRERGVDDFFGEPQMFFRCKDGQFITTWFHVICVQLNLHKTQFQKYCSKITRVTLAGDNVYSPVCVLKKEGYEDAGIPMIFRPQDQFVFACPDGMFVANSFHVLKLEI